MQIDLSTLFECKMKTGRRARMRMHASKDETHTTNTIPRPVLAKSKVD